MTTLELKLNLPDELAQRAQSAGLLTETAIQKLLEEAVRRESGRRLLEIAERLHAANIPPMTEEEIVAEVKAVRAERRARDAGRS
jgi:hypothetical protein